MKVAALCLLLPLAALRLPGQNLSGKFTGTIFDPSGGAVPNATIVMTNHKANSCAPSLALPPCTVDMTTSDADGNFVFKALPAGEYEMKVLKPGFAMHRAAQVVLEPGRDLAWTMKLEIGGLNEIVDVKAEGSPKASVKRDLRRSRATCEFALAVTCKRQRLLPRYSPSTRRAPKPQAPKVPCCFMRL